MRKGFGFIFVFSFDILRFLVVVMVMISQYFFLRMQVLVFDPQLENGGSEILVNFGQKMNLF